MIFSENPLKTRVFQASTLMRSALLIAGITLFSACSEDKAKDGSPDLTAEEKTQIQAAEELAARTAPETTINRGNVAEPDTLDPHKMSTVYENVIGRDLFCSVANRKPEGTIFPDCADSWEISEDGLTYTFYLRKDNYWSDGVPVVAADYVAGLRRVMNPATGSEQAAILDMIKNARAITYGELPLDTLGASAPDDYTLVIELERPSPTFLAIYGAPRGAPLPRHVFEKYGDQWVKAGNMVSNGPFLLREWRPHEYVHAVKNPDFYMADQVQLENVYYFPTDDYNAAVKRLRAGELDLNTQLPTQQVDFLRELMPDAVHIVPSLSVTYIIVNNTKEPFNDVRVRRALSMAIDRRVIAEKVMRMGEQPGWGLTPNAVSNYETPRSDFADWPMERRKEEAKRLLAEAGFGPGNPLKFEYRIRATDDGKRHAVAITSMWKEVGIEPEILGTEIKVHYADLQQSNFEVADAGWQSLDSPEDFLYLARTEAGVQNYGRYSNPEFDRMMNEALLIPNTKERNALMAKAETLLIEDQGLIPLYYSTNRNLVASYVRGYEDNPFNTHPTLFMWIDGEAAQNREHLAKTEAEPSEN